MASPDHDTTKTSREENRVDASLSKVGSECTCSMGPCPCSSTELPIVAVESGAIAWPPQPASSQPVTAAPASCDDTSGATGKHAADHPACGESGAPAGGAASSDQPGILADTCPRCSSSASEAPTSPVRTSLQDVVPIGGDDAFSLGSLEVGNDAPLDDSGACPCPAIDRRAPGAYPRAARGGKGPAQKLQYYTMEEVARHNKADDCWLVAHGRVYDVTSFVALHPAGATAILRHAGAESTRDFDFHSSGARNMWKEYIIGYVDDGSSRCIVA